MSDFFNFFVALFGFPWPDFCLGALAFLGISVVVLNLVFRRRAFKLK